MGTLRKISSAARDIYGCSEASEDTWVNYAYALLCIAGGDGEVSEAEINWLLEDFSELIDAHENFARAIKSFDYKNAVLSEIIGKIEFQEKINYKRALLYDAIKMSHADSLYSEDEREAVKKFAEILEIPEYMAKTIEGLVNTENSIEATRRSIFELDDKKIPDSEDKVRKTTRFVQHTYGLQETSDEIDLNYGFALMCIAGADGEVSMEEVAWYKDFFAHFSHIKKDIVDKVVAVDFKSLQLKDILEKLPHSMSLSFSKTLIYNAIKMARADGHYPAEEKEAVARVAEILEVPPNISSTLDYLIDAEEKVNQMRRTLFELE